MKRLSFWMMSGLVATGLLACQRADSNATNEKLDKLIAKVEGIEKKLDNMPAARPGAMPQRQAPAQPSPTEVYSVPVEGNPAKGPATAKVTIVEAAEFA